MGVIFYFSSCTADESSEQSNSILEIIYKLFGENTVTVFIVRKCAHMLEFTGLAFLLGWAWRFTRGMPSPLLTLGCASLYAVVDEVHQHFVEGRSSEVRDVFIDAAGALIGLLGFFVILTVIKAIKTKKSKKTENK